MAVSKLNPSAGGVPYGDNAKRPANPEIGRLFSNGEAGRLELYTSTGWQNIVQETPGVAAIYGTYNQSAGSGTFTISGTNFVAGGLVYAVGTNAIEYQATSSTTNSIVQMTATFTNLSAEYEPYDIKVVNPSNLFGLLPDAFFVNDNPVWSTASGSLGSYYGSTSIQLSATDDESSTLTYSITSGTLPSGLSLSSSGLISGTITANPGTYSFTVGVSDGANTTQTRSFSIIVPSPLVTGGTLSSDATYYYRTFTGNSNFVLSGNNLTTDVFIVAGGGPGGGAGGGGAGGVRALSSISLTPGTYPAVIGSGGAGTSSSGGPTTYTSLGTNSSFNNISATRGGGGGGYTLDLNGTSGGSGGGGGNQGGGVLSGSAGNSGGYNPVEGYAGGSGGAINFTNGGGGGAGGVGGNSTTSRSGDGGIGIQSAISGTNFYFGGGGGGGAQGNFTAGNGGNGGGGAGQASAGNTSGTPGAGLNSGGTAQSGGSASSYAGAGGANTGGGGGGMGTSVGTSGNGGSGIVVVRYTRASVGG
jgi:hypothetical protein